MKNELKSTLTYSFFGVVMGYVSFLINNNILALVLAIVALYVLYKIIQKAFKINEKFKWFFTNGGWFYLFFWFITWIVFYNL